MTPGIPVQAIWFCAAADMPHQRAAAGLPAPDWFPVPTTVLCVDPAAYQWFCSLDDAFGAEMVQVRQAFAPDDIRLELAKALQAGDSPYLHLRTHAFNFDRVSLDLLMADLIGGSDTAVSFEISVSDGPVHWMPASMYLRRHLADAVDRACIEFDVERFCVRREMVLNFFDRWHHVPVTHTWLMLLVDELRREQPRYRHIPLFCGNSERPAPGATRHAVRSEVVADRLEQLFLTQQDGMEWGKVGGHELVVAIVRHFVALLLVSELSPPGRQFFKVELAERLEPLWRMYKTEVSQNSRLKVLLDCAVADLMDLPIVRNIDLPLDEGHRLIANRLVEEAVLCSDRILKDMLAVVTGERDGFLDGEVEVEASRDGEERKRLLLDLRRTEKRLMTWRAECARQMRLVADERARNRELNRRNQELRQQVTRLRKGLVNAGSTGG